MLGARFDQELQDEDHELKGRQWLVANRQSQRNTMYRTATLVFCQACSTQSRAGSCEGAECVLRMACDIIPLCTS